MNHELLSQKRLSESVSPTFRFGMAVLSLPPLRQAIGLPIHSISNLSLAYRTHCEHLAILLSAIAYRLAA